LRSQQLAQSELFGRYSVGIKGQKNQCQRKKKRQVCQSCFWLSLLLLWLDLTVVLCNVAEAGSENKVDAVDPAQKSKEDTKAEEEAAMAKALSDLMSDMKKAEESQKKDSGSEQAGEKKDAKESTSPGQESNDASASPEVE
jgi:hypothetical protein